MKHVVFHVHERLRDTTGPAFQSSRRSGGLTISWDEPKTTRATVSPTFHTNTGARLRNSRASSQGQVFQLVFKWFNIHTSWYVNCPRVEAKKATLNQQFTNRRVCRFRGQMVRRISRGYDALTVTLMPVEFTS